MKLDSADSYYSPDDIQSYDEQDDESAAQMVGLSDDVDVGEIERALADDFCERRGRVDIELGGLTLRQRRNLFLPSSYEEALRKSGDPNPDIRAQAQLFLQRRLDAIGRYCMNLNCLGLILGHKRGRPRKFCQKSCEDADAKRRQRDRQNPDRGWRLVSLEPDARKVKRGYAGYRKFKRKGLPYGWVASAVSGELRAKLHRDAVEGSSVSPADRIAMEIDAEWSKRRAGRNIISLQNAREEYLYKKQHPDAFRPSA